MPAPSYHLRFDLQRPTTPHSRRLPQLTDRTPQQLQDLPVFIPPLGTDIFSDLPRHPDPSTYLPPSPKSNPAHTHKPPAHTDYRFARVSVESVNMAPHRPHPQQIGRAHV